MQFPVKIRLAKHEAEDLTYYIYQKSIGILKNPEVDNDLIVLAEYLETIKRKWMLHRMKPTSTPVVYTLPLSVVRILHLRFQKESISPALQMILVNLDQVLINMSMKPTLPIQLT